MILADDVPLICEYWVMEFYRCNRWLVRSQDRDMLIDSGMGVVSLREKIPLLTEKLCLTVARSGEFQSHPANLNDQNIQMRTKLP